MKSIEIESVKDFMSHLFIKDTFDHFLCKEISIQTFSTFLIDGSLLKDFLDEAEREELESCQYIPWSRLKPYCFNIIKGSRTPLSMKGIFTLSRKGLTEFVLQNQLRLAPEDIGGLYLNLRYENKTLNLITGTSLNTFTMDKSADHAWDEAVCSLLKRNQL